MLAVLVRTAEALAVAAVAALAAGAAGWWWLRRKARRLLAAQTRRLLARAGRPHWAGLVPDRPLDVAAWRRQAVRAAWLRLARAPRSAPTAPWGRDDGSGVPAGR